MRAFGYVVAIGGGFGAGLLFSSAFGSWAPAAGIAILVTLVILWQFLERS